VRQRQYSGFLERLQSQFPGDVGKPLRKSSSVSPPSSWSYSVWTCTRVPRKTGAPCIISGSLVIAEGHDFIVASLRSDKLDLSHLNAGNPQYRAP